MLKHFFDIQLSDSSSFFPLLVIYKILHGIMSGKEDQNIAIGFPEYYCDQGINGTSTIGKTLRIFSTYSQLIELKNHPSLKNIANTEEVNSSPIAEVPPHAVPVRFIRDRSVDRYFLNCRKHEEFREKAGTLRRLPCISFTSSGFSSPHNKGHGFSVFVRREDADQHITGSYTNYGLSHSGSTVPWFE